MTGSADEINRLPSLAERVDYLEIRLTEQDQTIEDLNTTILDQWKRIDDLVRRLERLSDRVQSVEDAGADPDDRPPPHY